MAERKSKINIGIITAALILILIFAQIVLLCITIFSTLNISWFITLLPIIITGSCVLIIALYFIIQTIIYYIIGSLNKIQKE